MTRRQTPVQLAHQIWPRLIVVAETHGRVTRQALAQRFGISGRALRDFDQILAPLESYCQRHALPPLFALIVGSNAEAPGAAAEAAAIEAETVYTYKWRDRSPVIPSEADFTAALASV